jgi:CheY-like chemotaxis protein
VSGHAAQGLATPHVLLAEDNEINALLALKALDKLGATADWARNGLEALALAQAALTEGARRYDLVLMDVRMPGLDGLEATRRIRLCEAGLAERDRTPVVALTANSLEEDEAAARRAGLDGFLTKPIGLDRLAALLAREAA